MFITYYSGISAIIKLLVASTSSKSSSLKDTKERPLIIDSILSKTASTSLIFQEIFSIKYLQILLIAHRNHPTKVRLAKRVSV